MRCPQCGALNPAGAQWCNQCLKRFTAPPPPPPPPPSSAAPEQQRGAARRGAFTVSDEGVTWRCPNCDSDNAIEDMACRVCGTPFAAAVGAEETKARRVESDPNTVALASLFFPGAGHAYMGLWGQAVARAILSLWAIGLTFAMGVAGSTVFAGLVGMIAFGLWAVAAHDAYRIATGDEGAILLNTTARYLGVVGALLILPIMAIVGAAIR